MKSRKPGRSTIRRPFAAESLEPRLLLANTLYVDANSPAQTPDGTSWNTAYADLQQALAAANFGDEIRVAKGTYKPTKTADRTVSFALRDGIRVLGGFAGVSQATPDIRDTGAYPTVLSGDIGKLNYTTDNSYHVLVSSNATSAAVLDGVTVTGGYADGKSLPTQSGGGMFNDASSPTLSNCTFRENRAFGYQSAGAGMYNRDSAPTLVNCTFQRNSASGEYSTGGGMFNFNSSPALTNCLFISNSIGSLSVSGASGGAICNNSSSPMLMNCTFESNVALGSASAGGGVFNDSSSAPGFANCTFLANAAGSRGGSISSEQSSPILKSCTFIRNTAIIGGAVYASGRGSPLLQDCYLLGNTASRSGAALYAYYASLTLTNCVVAGNTCHDEGSVSFGEYSKIDFINSTFVSNVGVGFSGRGTTQDLNNCIAWGNVGPNAASLPSVSFVHCDVHGGLEGMGNIDAEPLFVRSPWAGPDGVFGTSDDDYGDLRLRPQSPALDAGLSVLVPSGLTRDVAGNSRIQGTAVDLGAFEGSTAVQSSRIIYVDSAATGGGTGASWTDAFSTLQPAIAAAADGDTIRVAAGVYRPTSSSDRTASFVLRNAVALVGGYAGSQFTDADSRDPAVYCTNLSGDISSPDDDSDNSYHVVVALAASLQTVLDGFTIAAGRADSVSLEAFSDYQRCGGGILLRGGSPTFVRCVLKDNFAEKSGGGVFSEFSSALFETCAFEANLVGPGRGGGMYNVASSPTLRNCTFSGNATASDYPSPGIGLFGGAMYNSISTPTLEHCTFNGNVAGESGGAIYSSDCSAMMLRTCTFRGNTAGESGGAIYNTIGSPSVVDCLFLANAARQGGALYAQNASSFLNGCTFVSNLAVVGGGMYSGFGGLPELVNCVFVANRALVQGGGMMTGFQSAPTLRNCTFAGNSAASGGGLVNDTSLVDLVNCVFWGNTPKSLETVNSISGVLAPDPQVRYCAIQGSFAGDANLDSDPLFVRNPSPGPDNAWGTADDDYGDLHLQPNSPCIDAGYNVALPASLTTDLDGNPRLIGPTVDMGAYEATLSPTPGSSLNLTTGSYLLKSTTTLSSLTLSPTVSLDLGTNNLILTYTGSSPESQLQQYVKDALSSHNAHGLYTSATDSAFSQSGRVLAVFDNHDAHFTSFAGQTLSNDWNQVLVKYTYLGDANADGKVDPTDYAVVDGLQGLGHSWITGDLNFDGQTTPDDYAQIDGNQGAGYGGPGGPQLSSLPTPASPATPALTAPTLRAASLPAEPTPFIAPQSSLIAPASSPFSTFPLHFHDDFDLFG